MTIWALSFDSRTVTRTHERQRKAQTSLPKPETILKNPKSYSRRKDIENKSVNKLKQIGKSNPVKRRKILPPSVKASIFSITQKTKS